MKVKMFSNALVFLYYTVVFITIQITKFLGLDLDLV